MFLEVSAGLSLEGGPIWQEDLSRGAGPELGKRTWEETWDEDRDLDLDRDRGSQDMV